MGCTDSNATASAPTPAPQPTGPATASSPLINKLLSKGLTQQQINSDKWAALAWLPEAGADVMLVTNGFSLTDADRETLKQHATRVARDILTVVPSSAASAEIWFRAAARFGGEDPDRALMGTEAVRDALVTNSKQATSADSVRWFSSLICNLAGGSINQPDKQKLLGTAAVRDALVAVSAHATSGDAVRWWSASICNLTHGRNKENQQLLGTAAVRDALVALSAHAITAPAAEWLCAAICHLTNDNEQNKLLLRDPAVLTALQRLEKVASASEDAKEWWGKASAALSA
jgi:hypothetical protein